MNRGSRQPGEAAGRGFEARGQCDGWDCVGRGSGAGPGRREACGGLAAQVSNPAAPAARRGLHILP